MYVWKKQLHSLTTAACQVLFDCCALETLNNDNRAVEVQKCSRLFHQNYSNLTDTIC